MIRPRCLLPGCPPRASHFCYVRFCGIHRYLSGNQWRLHRRLARNPTLNPEQPSRDTRYTYTYASAAASVAQRVATVSHESRGDYQIASPAQTSLSERSDSQRQRQQQATPVFRQNYEQTTPAATHLGWLWKTDLDHRNLCRLSISYMHALSLVIKSNATVVPVVSGNAKMESLQRVPLGANSPSRQPFVVSLPWRVRSIMWRCYPPTASRAILYRSIVHAPETNQKELATGEAFAARLQLMLVRTNRAAGAAVQQTSSSSW